MVKMTGARGVSCLHGECKIWDEPLRMNTAVEWGGDGKGKNDMGSKICQNMVQVGSSQDVWNTQSPDMAASNASLRNEHRGSC